MSEIFDIRLAREEIARLEAELAQEIEWNGMKERHLREGEARIAVLLAELADMTAAAELSQATVATLKAALRELLSLADITQPYPEHLVVGILSRARAALEPTPPETKDE